MDVALLGTLLDTLEVWWVTWSYTEPCFLVQRTASVYPLAQLMGASLLSLFPHSFQVAFVPQ